jgi:hypothetical protein
MSKTDVDWQVHTYGGTLHGFTNPEAYEAGVPAHELCANVRTAQSEMVEQTNEHDPLSARSLS